MIEEINLIDFDSDAPKNKMRKVIFRDNSGLNTKQKQQSNKPHPRKNVKHPKK